VLTDNQIGILVFTYNRPSYLSYLLEDLSNQDSPHPFELLIIDNGTDDEFQHELNSVVAACPLGLTFIRHSDNVLSWSRLKQAIESMSSSYILFPGDDDRVSSGFVRKMHELSLVGDQPSMISSACQIIDSKDNLSNEFIFPPDFSNEAVALATLFCNASYPLPATGIRRDVVLQLSDPFWPRVRSGYDWWMWIQAWLSGPAAVTQEVLVRYRKHEGQEQLMYSNHFWTTEAMRMLSRVVSSSRFQEVSSLWDLDRVEQFVETLLSLGGPNWGVNPSSAQLQMQIAEVLAHNSHHEPASRLFSDAAARSGFLATPDIVSTLIGNSSPKIIWPESWLNVPLSWKKASNCPAANSWWEFFGGTSRMSRDSIEVGCNMLCTSDWEHVVTFRFHFSKRTMNLNVSRKVNSHDIQKITNIINSFLVMNSRSISVVGVENFIIELVARIKKLRVARLVGRELRRRGFYR
jgi:hypothetical protein